MSTRRAAISTLFVIAAALGNGLASGQNFPNRPIRIFTGGVGGGNDNAARLIAPGISGPLGQPVVIENRPTAVSIELVSKATPDGYSLLIAGPGMWIGPFTLGEFDYDPLKEFAPISLLAVQVLMLVVHPSLPVKSVKELIALAKAKPGQLNYASGTPGSNNQLGGEALKAMTGVNIVGIPFKGAGEGVTSLVGGHVQLMFTSISSVAPHVQSGRLRALGVTSSQPSALAPGLPAVAASLPGFELLSFDNIFAPARTPAPIINQLNREIARFLRSKDAREKYLLLGADVVASTPGELEAKIRSELTKMSKIIKDSGIRS